jgi:hypothetical protein
MTKESRNQLCAWFHEVDSPVKLDKNLTKRIKESTFYMTAGWPGLAWPGLGRPAWSSKKLIP